MTAAVKLHNLSDGYIDEVIVENIDNKQCFTYIDNQMNNCEICIYDDGICLFRQCKDHLLELHLKDSAYAKITTEQGIVRIDIKVVDFHSNSDILLVHYLIDDEERAIEVKYY